MMEILLGAGSNHIKKISLRAGPPVWNNLTTVDMNPAHKPDLVWDLRDIPLPFDDDSASEIHAYDVMEHIGRQGDYKFFFRQWEDLWRILRPGGLFCGISPASNSPWAWGDPGHTRIIGPECLVFLDQTQYTKQVGITPMTDYRFCYKADFKHVGSQITNDLQHFYVLEAVKPSRLTNGGGHADAS